MVKAKAYRLAFGDIVAILNVSKRRRSPKYLIQSLAIHSQLDGIERIEIELVRVKRPLKVKHL